MRSTLSFFLMVVAAVFPTLSNGQDGLPCILPYFLNEGQCVDECPSLHVGNHTTGQCEPLPPNFRLAVNATRHFANITTDTLLGTAIRHFSVIINNTYFQRPELYSISIVQNDQTERLFKLGNGQNDEDGVLTDPINPFFDDFDPSNDIVILEREIIYANEPTPEDREGLPQIFMFDLNVLVVARFGLPSIAESTTVGIVHLAEPEDLCQPNPCLNGGTCVGRSGSCICAAGFSGSSCGSEDSCREDTCLNGGTCIEEVGDETSCMCASGFTGSNCSIDVNFSGPLIVESTTTTTIPTSTSTPTSTTSTTTSESFPNSHQLLIIGILLGCVALGFFALTTVTIMILIAVIIIAKRKDNRPPQSDELGLPALPPQTSDTADTSNIELGLPALPPQASDTADTSNIEVDHNPAYSLVKNFKPLH